MNSKKVTEILNNKTYVNNPKLTEEIKNFTIQNIVDQGDGYVESLTNFGFLCSNGIGVKKDIFITKMCYMKSIELGGGHYPMNNLGYLYDNEYNDIENAIKWLISADESGSIVSAWNLGCLYEYRLNDLKNAEIWYKKAADAGHKGAIEKMKKYRKLDKIYLDNEKKIDINDCFKDNACIICTDPLLGSSEIIIVKCGHVYHKTCLDNNKGRCALKCIP